MFTTMVGAGAAAAAEAATVVVSDTTFSSHLYFPPGGSVALCWAPSGSEGSYFGSRITRDCRRLHATVGHNTGTLGERRGSEAIVWEMKSATGSSETC